MEKILKKTLWPTVTTTLFLATLLLIASCDNTEILPKYTVNFVGEGVSIEPQSVVHGNYATAPKNPEREGYDFAGWFTDNDTFINEWDFKTDIVTQNVTLYTKWEESIWQDYPIEIPFEEYSLIGTSCQWANFEPNKVTIINSDEELSNYIVCIDDDYPKIDFDTKTLLFASGGTNNGVVDILIKLLLENNNYSLDIDITLDDSTVAQGWYVAVTVDKINTSSVALNVNQHH
ncbi:InlB B-repeat-containing protein [Bacteroidales bacterium OttesenSCG-928-C03]|nr:InlB B-repeat-containing protein [Bacteroidales bacterium OttesenSCG-928-C03]